MSHPTTEELFEFIDNRRGKEETDKIAAHLAVCPACRQRVEMERSIKHIVRHEPLFNAPAGLAALVMVNVAAPSRDSLALRVLGKLGSLVAMAVVLAVIGFAIVQVSSVNDQSDKTLSSITKITGPLSTMYTKGMQTFYHGTTTITETIETTGDVQFWKAIFIIALAIGVLAAVDRMFGGRFIKLRS